MILVDVLEVSSIGRCLVPRLSTFLLVLEMWLTECVQCVISAPRVFLIKTIKKTQSDDVMK